MSNTEKYDDWLKNRYITKEQIKMVVTQMYKDKPNSDLDVKTLRCNINQIYKTNYNVIDFAAFDNYIHDIFFEINMRRHIND
jgi:hypothetical protein